MTLSENFHEEKDMKTDIQLGRHVEAQLDWDPRFDSQEITVTVKNGTFALGSRQFLRGTMGGTGCCAVGSGRQAHC
jgi:hypothetical protein